MSSYEPQGDRPLQSFIGQNRPSISGESALPVYAVNGTPFPFGLSERQMEDVANRYRAGAGLGELAAIFFGDSGGRNFQRINRILRTLNVQKRRPAAHLTPEGLAKRKASKAARTSPRGAPPMRTVSEEAASAQYRPNKSRTKRSDALIDEGLWTLSQSKLLRLRDAMNERDLDAVVAVHGEMADVLTVLEGRSSGQE